MDENPEQYPLVERFNKAEYLARELSEHLRQAFLPKLAELRSASKVPDPEEVTDHEILDRMKALLQAEDFAADVFERLMRYLRSIEKESRRIMGLGKPVQESPDE